MPETKEEKTDSYTVIDDNGNRFQVHQYTTFTECRPLSGGSQWLPGSIEYRTEYGDDVNANDDDSFEEVQTGRLLRRV